MQTRMMRAGGEILALAVVYFITARFSLLLALPPGYATPIWPAAGIGLAAVLFFGNRVAPGIWLGSFLANLASSSDATSTAPLVESLLVSAGLAAAGTLQAIAGAFLIRRFVGFPTPLDQARDVIRFLGLGGPISCVIGASVGVTTLVLAGTLPAGSYAFSWWAWWIGDAIGVLVATPLVLAWFGQPHAIWRRRRHTVAIPILLTFAVILGVFAAGKDPLFAAPQTWVAWLVLAGGMAFTGLLGAFLLVTSGHAMLFEQLATEGMAELERKRQTEEALRRERAQMKAILDNAPMFISIRNVHGATVLANRSIQDALNVPPLSQEDIGRGVPDLFPREMAEHLSDDDLAALSSDGPIRAEETIRLKDGTSHTYLTVRFPVRHLDTEEPFGICAISTDITDRKRTELELRQSVAQLRATFDQAAVGIAHISLPERRFLSVNDTFCRMTGYERDELLARVAPDIIHPNDRMIGGEQYQRLVREDISSFTMVKRYVRKNGQVIWARITVSAVRNENGDTPNAMDVIEDITDAKLAEQARQDTERRLALAVDIAQLGFWEWNVETNELYWSPRFKKQLGYEDHELPGKIAEWQSRIHPEDRERVLDFFSSETPWVTSECYEVQYRLRHRDGNFRWFLARTAPATDPDGKLVKLIGTQLDITERKVMERSIREAAQHDALTGLPNRALILEFADHLIAASQRHHGRVALLFIDLDRFKPINDLHGHEVGDRLLQEVAHRLSNCIRKEDMVGRIGGDEFLIVLSHLTDSHWAATVARHVLDSIERPFPIDSRELSISSSIGISYFPQHGNDVDVLVHAADVAMYRAKQSGRGSYEIYTAEHDDHVEESCSIEQKLKAALENDGLALHYQPIVDINSGRPVGVEALVRLVGEDAEALGPASFIPVAESTGLIEQLGEWVAGRACRQHKEWLGMGLPPITIAINVSPLQFRQKDFAELLDRTVSCAGIDPGCLQFEVAESTVMEHVEESAETLMRIKSLGAKVALDHFGTGFSSLGQLGILPLDELKIDRSFVRGIDKDPNSQAITGAILALGRELALKVVGEGVESEDTRLYLSTHGCDHAQGFLFSRPMPPDELASWYRAHSAGA